MGFCSYSKEFRLSSYTSIENQFITKYMATADGDAVKVYLFGLFLCQNVQNEYSLSEASRTLNMSEQKIVDLFRFWEDFDLLEIVSESPFSVRYFPAEYGKGKPKRIRTEKYSDFNKAVQSLIPKRMITAAEFMRYFSIMEEYSIKPEALLLIIRYCIDLKGETIAQNYILQVAKNFAAEGVTTIEQIEQKLSDYTIRNSDLSRVLLAMGSSKKPEPEDYQRFKKWTTEYGFELSAIEYTASLYKKGGLSKLDEVLQELYTNKKFDKAEIREFLARKTEIRNLTLSIAKELGVYCPVIDTYTDNFVSRWLALGYDDASLVLLAKYCFRREKKSFEKMDQLIQKLTDYGVVSSESIVAYIEAEAREQTFLAEVLKKAGLSRRVNNWDRECLRNWRAWNFSDEMILRAAETAVGKASPLPYITSVLSSWKAKGFFSPDQLPQETAHSNYYQKQLREERSAEFRKKVENYYFNLREQAQDRADHYRKLAEGNAAYRATVEEIKTTEISLAKAEAFGTDTSKLSEILSNLQGRRAKILHSMNLTEEMLTPQYRCKQCKDTGFDADGNVCQCYKEFIENASDEKRLENILDAYSNIEL